jgi:uncharacterized protein
MGLLVWIVAPAIIPRTSLHPMLVHWMLIVVGMMWQFVVALAILRRELGGLRWSSIKQRIWLNLPRDPHTGKARKVLFLWTVPAIAANVVGIFLGIRLDQAWTNWLPGFDEPSYANLGVLADPQFQGQWWILGIALTHVLFNYLFGEELLFHYFSALRFSAAIGGIAGALGVGWLGVPGVFLIPALLCLMASVGLMIQAIVPHRTPDALASSRVDREEYA